MFKRRSSAATFPLHSFHRSVCLPITHVITDVPHNLACINFIPHGSLLVFAFLVLYDKRWFQFRRR